MGRFRLITWTIKWHISRIILIQNISNKAQLSDLGLANVEALAQGEDNTPPTYNCPGGSKECVRVTRGNEVHIFYEQN